MLPKHLALNYTVVLPSTKFSELMLLSIKAYLKPILSNFQRCIWIARAGSQFHYNNAVLVRNLQLA